MRPNTDALLQLLVDSCLHDHRRLSLADNDDRVQLAAALIHAVEVYVAALGANSLRL